MRKTKRCLATFSLCDQEAIETRLEKMAAHGWMLRTAGRFFWTYTQIPPQRLRFSVTYFPDASALDPVPGNAQRLKESLCEQDGWKLAARWDAVQIFYTEHKDAVPIDTDPVTQVRTIFRTMKRKVIRDSALICALLVYFIVLWAAQFRADPLDTLSDPYAVFSLPCLLLLFAASLHEALGCVLWHRKARRAAQSGVFLPVRIHRRITLGLVALSAGFGLLALTGRGRIAFFAVWITVFALIFLLAQKLSNSLKQRGVSRGVNRFVTVLVVLILYLIVSALLVAGMLSGVIPLFGQSKPVGTCEWNGRTLSVYDDPLPLETESLVDVSGFDVVLSKEASHQSTPFLSLSKYKEEPLPPGYAAGKYTLEYTVIDVRFPPLYGFVRRTLYDAYQDETDASGIFIDHYEPVDASLWGADEVYQRHWSSSVLGTYLVCWKGRIAEVRFYWQPTPEQIQIAADALRP